MEKHWFLVLGIVILGIAALMPRIFPDEKGLDEATVAVNKFREFGMYAMGILALSAYVIDLLRE